jgi:methionine synthase II (cobalamin-independent)
MSETFATFRGLIRRQTYSGIVSASLADRSISPRRQIASSKGSTERAGDFTPLRHLPPGKTVVLGLVSTKTPVLEDKPELKRRIDQAGAKIVPLEHLCLSPQCVFASNFMGNPLTIDDERRKLELVVETALEIWG